MGRIIGNGRIAFAHVEQTIDFPNVEGIRAYVKWNEDHKRKTYYKNCNCYWSPTFREAEHIFKTGDRQYTIEVMFAYNDCNIGI